MAKFVAEEYKEQLNASSSCETCEKVPVQKLKKDSPYIFISYSHKDYKMVYSDLADLYESNIPFWYDSGLPAGKNWDDVVRERMTDPRCLGIIFYLSENLFLSHSIQTEIRIACDEQADPSLPKNKKNYFCVNLTDMLPSKILKRVYPNKEFPDTEDEMQAQREWISTLTDAFPDKATYLSFNSPRHKEKLIEQIGVNFGIDPNYNPYDFRTATLRSGNAIIEFESGAVYNGEFLNGVFEGQGTLTYTDGAKYSGNWSNGKRHGQGSMTYPNGDSYSGEWAYGKKHGQGTFVFPDGASYSGEWAYGKRHGQGTYVFSNGASYTGNWANDKVHGQGTLTRPNGVVYRGEWMDGKAHGQGAINHPDGASYTGEWKDGKMHGHGTAILPNNTSYTGKWIDGNTHGQGTMTYPSGATYIGEWLAGKRHGQGTMTYPDGASRSGTWDGDILLEGEGVMRYPDGSSYDGQIKNNLRHGKGRYTLADGTVQEGFFENDVFIGKIQ